MTKYLNKKINVRRLQYIINEVVKDIVNPAGYVICDFF